MVEKIGFEKYVYQTLLMERVPVSIAKNPMDCTLEWWDLELYEINKQLIAYNAVHRNSDHILRRHNDMEVEMSAKIDCKVADKSARLERELEEQKQPTNYNFEAQKQWANSDEV
jgi:hypothetical protein